MVIIGGTGEGEEYDERRKEKGASLNLLPMNRVCTSEGGESNVPNTSRKARTISFDAPPPPFLPTTNPSNSGACYCSCVSMYFPPTTGEIDQKKRFRCANRGFSNKNRRWTPWVFLSFLFPVGLYMYMCIGVSAGFLVLVGARWGGGGGGGGGGSFFNMYKGLWSH